MLRLRRGTVREAASPDSPEQALTVELDGGELRPAIADVGLVGRCEQGDEVLVNVEAYDLGLGSGGFDVVHANLTRGLDGQGLPGAHVMKLNYSSLQHAVLPVEERYEPSAEAQGPALPLRDDGVEGWLTRPLRTPVAVLALHGQLAPLAWAFAQTEERGLRLGYLQTPGGAVSGAHCHVVRELRARGLLVGHITVGACYGGEEEALTLAGALHHAARTLSWDAVVCGPGPGIVGTGSAFGHGGMQALDSTQLALALGAVPLLVPRMSSGDPRARHKGISHHTATVLELLSQKVFVTLPEGFDFGGELPSGWQRHEWNRMPADVTGYAGSGLPIETMGRSLEQDPLFFASALAGGEMLWRLAGLKRLGRR